MFASVPHKRAATKAPRRGSRLRLAAPDSQLITLKHGFEPNDDVGFAGDDDDMDDDDEDIGYAGDDAARPEWLEPEYGIRDGQYYLTEVQAQAILDLRLHKLTGLEHEKIINEYKENG